ncbi:DHH family phosphoesterase [Candidatus Woesearchaeota archaeon]|nr:DHH family phosphoesterase [Candidatus Woesearchaeota archaeon]
MHIINQDLIDRFIEFIHNIKPNDKIAIFYDNDPDGVCSGVLLYKALKNLLGCEPVIFECAPHDETSYYDEIIVRLKRKNVNKIFILDLVVESRHEVMKKLEEFAELVIIDHHPLEKNISSDRTIFIKPELYVIGINPTRYCTTKQVFDLLSHVIDISKYEWLAVMGIIGDYAYDSWQDFMEHCFRKYDVKEEPDIYQTMFGKATRYLNYVRTIDNKEVKEVAEYLLKIEDFGTAFSILERYKKIEDEINKFIDGYEKFSEEYPEKDLLIVHVQTAYKINSSVATQLSRKRFPRKVVITYFFTDGHVWVSARRQDGKADMGKLLRKCIEGFEEANAGGHVPAAGCSILKEDWPEFKKRLIENTGK